MLLYLINHSRPENSNRELSKFMDGATIGDYFEMLYQHPA
jgi:hypothetical protein